MKYINTFNESKKNNPKYKKIDIDGVLVYQGRDAVSNDYVTFELSDPNDYWLHAKGVPGSHVLIKCDKEPSIDIIKKAAKIAAKNSKSKSDDVLVIYCKKKFVEKEEGMNDGQVKVDYKNSNEITVNKN